MSYIAGALTGNPSLFVFDGPVTHGYRNIVSASEALNKHGLGTIKLQPKEHLSIVNGTAFSAALAALCLHDAVHLAILSQVCTAMGTEALLGERQNYDPFIHEVARPHPGQVSSASSYISSKIRLMICTGASRTSDMGSARRQPIRSRR